MEGDLEKLTQGEGRDLHNLQVKLTHVGAQLKGRPSAAFTTFYHLLRMDWFVPARSPDLSYGNDEGEVWNFTVAPEEIGRVVKALAASPEARAPGGGEPSVSLSLVLAESRLGRVAHEVVLDAGQAGAVIVAMRDALDADNGLARRVLDRQRELL